MYDFIVVGAGPAGSSAAERLAKKGARVLMLERKQEIGSPVQCGEGMSIYELERIGMRGGEHVVRKIDHVELVFPKGSFVVRQKMASIDRSVLDRNMAEMAESSGAILKASHTVSAIKRRDYGWSVISRGEEYSGRYIVGADGYSSIVARSIHHGIKQDFIVGTSVRGRKAGEDAVFSFHFSSRYPHGYGYVFSREGEMVNAGVVLKGRDIGRENRRFLSLMRIKPREFRGGAIPFAVHTLSHHGWHSLLVGDAAGLANSITYGGIYAAVMSGRMAADAGMSAMERGKDFPSEYEKMLRRSDFYQNNPKKEHDMVYSMSERDMRFLGELVSGKSMDEISIPSSLASVIKMGRISMIPRLISLYLYFRRNSEIL